MTDPAGLDQSIQLAAVLDLTRYYQPEQMESHRFVADNQQSSSVPYAAEEAQQEPLPIPLAQFQPPPHFTPLLPTTTSSKLTAGETWRLATSLAPRVDKSMGGDGVQGSSKGAARKKRGRWNRTEDRNRDASSSHGHRSQSRKRIFPPSPTSRRAKPPEWFRDDGGGGIATTSDDIPSDFELVDEEGGSDGSTVSSRETGGDGEELEEGECSPAPVERAASVNDHEQAKKFEEGEAEGILKTSSEQRANSSLLLQLSVLQRQLDSAVKSLREEKSKSVALANKLGSTQSDANKLASRLEAERKRNQSLCDELATAREENANCRTLASQLDEQKKTFQRTVKDHIAEMKAKTRELYGAQRLLVSERQRSGDLKKNLLGLKEQCVQEVQQLRAGKEAAEAESATLRLRNDSMRQEVSAIASIKAELDFLQGKLREAETELVAKNKLIESLRSLKSLEVQERAAEAQAALSAEKTEKQSIAADLETCQQRMKELEQQLVESDMDVASVRCTLSNKERMLASAKSELDQKTVELGITRAELKATKAELLEERVNSAAQELILCREHLHHVGARCTELESECGRLSAEKFEVCSQLKAVREEKVQLYEDHQRAVNGQLLLKGQNKKLSSENSRLKKRQKELEEESHQWRGKYEGLVACARGYERQRAELDRQFFGQLAVGDPAVLAAGGNNPTTPKRTLSSVLLSSATNRPSAGSSYSAPSPISTMPNLTVQATTTPQQAMANSSKGKSKKRKIA